jgi:anthranilate phosphoribosyltransferase
VLNAAAAIWLAGRSHDLAEGITVAQESIDDGAARDRLDAFVGTTRALATT